MYCRVYTIINDPRLFNLSVLFPVSFAASKCKDENNKKMRRIVKTSCAVNKDSLYLNNILFTKEYMKFRYWLLGEKVGTMCTRRSSF
jgi:hypothetical protein